MTKAAGFLFRIDDERERGAIQDFDGLIVSGTNTWDEDLLGIKALDIAGKSVSILGMDSPDDFMPPTWVEVMQLRDAFISCGAQSVEYVHYEDNTFTIDM